MRTKTRRMEGYSNFNNNNKGNNPWKNLSTVTSFDKGDNCFIIFMCSVITMISNRCIFGFRLKYQGSCKKN